MGRVIVWLGDVSREATDETAAEVAATLKRERPDLASFGEVSFRRPGKSSDEHEESLVAAALLCRASYCQSDGNTSSRGRSGSYEDAPATALVAIQCCVCGRPLLEAESLKSGIGPICAEKTGYGREGVPSEVRTEVNSIVYRLAALQKSPDAVPLLGRLRDLGFGSLADRIEERLASVAEIEVKQSGDLLLLILPKLDDLTFRKVLADLRTVPNRRFFSEEKAHSIPANDTRAKRALWSVICRHFSGKVLRSGKGLSLIPGLLSVAA